jgi:hypothetical protein
VETAHYIAEKINLPIKIEHGLSEWMNPEWFAVQPEFLSLNAMANIFPEIDMPGHMGAAIRAYPELNHPKDEKEKKYALRSDAMARDFCKTVLTEINDLFDPEYIHIGFDEVNLGAKAKLYTDADLIDFAKDITTFIKEDLKKTPIVWDDIFVHGLHDKDVVVQWWRYGKNYWWRNLELPVDEELNQGRWVDGYDLAVCKGVIDGDGARELLEIVLTQHPDLRIDEAELQKAIDEHLPQNSCAQVFWIIDDRGAFALTDSMRVARFDGASMTWRSPRIS